MGSDPAAGRRESRVARADGDAGGGFNRFGRDDRLWPRGGLPLREKQDRLARLCECGRERELHVCERGASVRQTGDPAGHGRYGQHVRVLAADRDSVILTI